MPNFLRQPYSDLASGHLFACSFPTISLIPASVPHTLIPACFSNVLPFFSLLIAFADLSLVLSHASRRQSQSMIHFPKITPCWRMRRRNGDLTRFLGCDACRARKVRCARENPEDPKQTCKHCIALGIPCTYEYQPKKRGPPNL
jgi:hypothetical protein